MITIHATKKLYARLPVDDHGHLPDIEKQSESTENQNPLGDWHANLITLQRHNNILLVHDKTCFALFIKHLLKADYARFQWYFEDALMNTLIKAGASEEQLNNAAGFLAPCRFDTDCNRSVQGTMNQMAKEIDHLLWFDNLKLEDISAFQTGAWLSDAPRILKNTNKHIWSKEAMLELLS